MSWLLRIVTNALALAAAAGLFHGIRVTGASDGDRLLTLLAVALVFGLVNALVRPVVAILSLPLYLLPLGLFFFVVNTLLLMLTSWLARQLGVGFHVRGFWTAIWGAIVISLVSWGIGLVLPDDE
ncbi:MAG: phage holin family protein [Nocardioidaceae bacterium]